MGSSKSEIIYKLSNKYNLPAKVIKEIISSQFKFTAMIMSSGNFDTIRLPYLGKFTVNPNRVKHITKRANAKFNKIRIKKI
jgi:nucleoid DNA-binding protein